MNIVKPVLYTIAVLLGILLLALVLLAVAPPRWLGEQASRLGSDALGIPLRIERLDVQPFSLTPAVDASSVSLGGAGEVGSPPLEGLNARLSVDLLAALRLRLLFDEVTLDGAAVALLRGADGSTNLDALLERFGGEPPSEPEPVSEDSRPLGLPAIRRFSLSETSVSVQDDITPAAAALQLSADGSTVDPDAPSSVSVEGRLRRDGQDVPVSLEAMLASDTPLQEGIGDIDLALQARMGALAASVDGRVQDAMGQPALDAAVVISGDNLDAVRALAGIEQLPAVPAFRFAADVSNQDSELRVQGLDATLGDSAFEGDVRIDPGTTPPTLFATLLFTAVDLDELLAIAVGDGVEDADVDESERSEDVVAGEPGGWFPDRELGLAQLSGTFDGEVQLRAEGIESAWPLDSVELGIALPGDRIRIAPVQLSLAGGSVEGELDIDTAGQRPEGSLELALQRLELVRIVEALGIDDDSAGVLGGRLRYWFAGDTVADIAGSVDGGTFLLMTGGRLDALLGELVGLDVVETVTLLADPGKTLTPIDCAYIDVLATEGAVQIEQFVVDTSDTVIIADGTVDLGEQSFDLAVEPHAKDASLISAQTPVAIAGGNGRSLSILPGPEMIGRAALAGLLGTVAAPAAALLPFIRAGSGEDSVFCDGLMETMDERRQ